MRSLTRRTLETISSMARPAWATCSEPLSTFSTDLPIRGLDFLGGFGAAPGQIEVLRWRRPQSRGLVRLRAAASTAAFRAGMLVMEGDAVNDADDVADLAGAFR